MSAPFVTDEMVEAVARKASFSVFCWLFADVLDGSETEETHWLDYTDEGREQAKKEARIALETAAPLWLAHFRSASEHLGHYTEAAKVAAVQRQMAAAAAEIERQGAAQLEKGATT